mmetsp:Transcript_52077/g.169152  ORF Transcript_52077/g.169152 Transcript_52077/m.169152 type:complete len:289 (+) Transcript_52077:180-1046(+)
MFGPGGQSQRSFSQFGVPSPGKVSAKPLDFVVLILLPWLIFSLIVSLYVFAYQEFAPLVWALVGASALLAFLFISMGSASGKAAQIALGLLVLTAVGMAVPVGLMVERRYMSSFWEVDSGAEYYRVSPLAPAASYGDASVMRFESGSFVDTHRSLGFMKIGDVYCVAPVLGQSTSLEESSPQYWAVGKNCCNQRGGFDCGDVGIQGASTGVVVSEGLGSYQSAVRMAVAAYELKASQGPNVFVRWTANAELYKVELWDRALTTTAIASGMHFMGSSAAGLLLARGLLR